MLDCLPIEVHARVGRTAETEDDFGSLDARGRRDIGAALQRLRETRDLRGVTVVINRLPPQHVGLGSKTATVLAALRACALAGGWDAPEATLQHLSGRGGASGVGIHGFFCGGFVADGGHNVSPEVGFFPSSSGRAEGVPPLCARLEVPPDWRFHLFLPEGNCVAGANEEQFFRENAPIPADEAHAAICSMYHGVIPAIAAGSIATLAHALRAIHRSGFKSRELGAQLSRVQGTYRALAALDDVAVGMSSMGPLIYAVTGSSDVQLESELLRVARQHGAKRLAVARARNLGCEIGQSDGN